MLPGIIELHVPPMADRRFIREAAAWVEANTVPDTLVCDKDRLVGYYSGHPYALWLGSAERPELDALAALGQQHPHMLITALYLVDRGDVPRNAIGPYQAVAAFQSQTAAAHDLLVLYARRDDRIFPGGAAPVLSTLPAAMLRPPATGP
jgi:hypothetical protein